MSILLQLAIIALLVLVGYVVFVQHKGSIKSGWNAFLGKKGGGGHGGNPHDHH